MAKGGRPPLYVDEPGRFSHSLRLRGSTDAVIRESARANSRSIAGELEARIEASIAGETQDDKLRRLIAEGIAADREAQRRSILARATPFVVGSQHGLAMSNLDFDQAQGLARDN